jgi:predicted RNase H-like nuclease
MIVGVDGCPSGWICALGTIEDYKIKKIEMQFVLHPDEIWKQYAVQKMCIDMPIGLPNQSKKGGRVIDTKARKILGKGGSARVFSPPIRQVLYCADYQDALQRSKETPPDGVGLSKQSFYLLPKIRQIDEWLRKDPKLQKSIFETHPELSFWAMGKQTAPSKHTTEGKEFRIQLLTQAGIWDESFFDIIEKERKRSNIISKDDILDALACMWSAYRCLHGIEQIIGKDEVFYDEEGFLMRYTF